LGFPRIQGADCCGIIVAVGDDINEERIGERVLVRTMMAEGDPTEFISICTGSERDGGFAQYMTTRSHHALSINSNWSDVELASIPCAYSTAEGLLHRSNVGGETVLVTGASGGVGSAAIQLAKRRGAKVIALASLSKKDDVLAAGADVVLDRDASLVAELGADSVDVVIDLVAGPNWSQLLDVLRRGGRYATSGAIAGPIVDLDVRTLYLKDLSFFGCTYQDDVVFENLVKYIEENEIKPLVAKTYPLKDIVAAQKDFLEKKFTGKLVLIP
jgi:NADPH:quinone reductase-like Zn-dependent oxidoreductase